MDTHTIIWIVAIVVALVAVSLVLWSAARHREIQRQARIADARDEMLRRDDERLRRASSAADPRRFPQPHG
jgi:hypothetical protein